MALATVDVACFETGSTFRAAEAQKNGIGGGVSIVQVPAPPHASESNCLKLASHPIGSTWKSFIAFPYVQRVIAEFIVRFDVLPNTNTIPLITVRETSIGSAQITIRVVRVNDSIHRLAILDANGFQVAESGDNPFTANTWHRLGFTFQQSTIGSAFVYVDGENPFGATFEDFDDETGADLYIALQGETGVVSDTPTQVYVNSYYVKTGADFTNFIGDFEVLTYNPTGDGQTPDLDKNGSMLASDLTANIADAGTWDKLADDATTQVEYSSIKEGLVFCNGPHGDLGSDVEIHGAKWTWWLNASLVSGDANVYYGYYIDGVFTLTEVPTTATRRGPWNVFSTSTPTFDGTFIIGFGNDLGLRTIRCQQAWCFLLVTAKTPRVSTVDIKGGDILGGGIAV